MLFMGVGLISISFIACSSEPREGSRDDVATTVFEEAQEDFIFADINQEVEAEFFLGEEANGYEDDDYIELRTASVATDWTRTALLSHPHEAQEALVWNYYVLSPKEGSPDIMRAAVVVSATNPIGATVGIS